MPGNNPKKFKFYIAALGAILFAQASFGQDFLRNSLQAFHLAGAQSVPPPQGLEVAFSPDGGATDLIVKAIRSAHKDIHVAAYSFTSRPIADALIAVHRAGVAVEVVFDHEEVERRRHSLAADLAAAGVPVRVDIVHELQHDKYMVIDGRNVETGSFNFTYAAEHHNSENVMVLWNDPQLAAAYDADWQNLWDKAEAYGGQ